MTDTTTHNTGEEEERNELNNRSSYQTAPHAVLILHGQGTYWDSLVMSMQASTLLDLLHRGETMK